MTSDTTVCYYQWPVSTQQGAQHPHVSLPKAENFSRHSATIPLAGNMTCFIIWVDFLLHQSISMWCSCTRAGLCSRDSVTKLSVPGVGAHSHLVEVKNASNAGRQSYFVILERERVGATL